MKNKGVQRSRDCPMQTGGCFPLTHSTISKISKRGHMVREFPGIRKLLDYWKVNNSKFQKLRRESHVERNFPIRNFRRFLYTSQGCPSFREFQKMLSQYYRKFTEFKSEFSVEQKMKRPECIEEYLRNGQALQRYLKLKRLWLSILTLVMDY